MNYTKFLPFFIFFINSSHAMDVCPLWENMRKDALNHARNRQRYPIQVRKNPVNLERNSIQREHYQKIDSAETINDIVCLIQEQAYFAIQTSRKYDDQIQLQEIIKKACPGITTNNMHFCLRGLELLFTGKTTHYDTICKKMTLNAIQLLLRENMKGNDSFYSVELLP